MSGQVEASGGRCEDCGLAIAGGAHGCQAVFEQLIARDWNDARYGRMHRLLVDTYALQHPRYCASGKSFAAHLTGLAWALETGGDPAAGHGALRRWLDGPHQPDKPALPAFRGGLTIGDVRGAGDPAAHAAAVERWARATWDAYAALQPLARTWLREAFAGSAPRAR